MTEIETLITQLIDYYFPPTSVPVWVNYRLFRAEKFSHIFNNIMITLHESHPTDDEITYDEPELLFAYVSDQLKIDHHCQITIPQNIIRLFHQDS